ncbi:Clavaminate synthase-like protein [Xylariaceae sp. FL1651]|nr:Clavaminate synthase-like protein [Xylariaceae sp. FL1651]
MSMASIQIPPPVSPHLDRVVGDNSSRLPLPLIQKQEIGSNRFVGVGTLPQQTKDSPKPTENDRAGEPEPNIKPLALSPPPPKSITERAKAASIVLNRYRIEYKNDWDIPESILYSQSQIHRALEKQVAIELVIPAFPFKSSNRSKKVLGPLPDEAERLSLLHLNGLCLAIKDATDADTFLTIVSDGITYNDILGVSDQEVWRYGQHLRLMAEQNGCDCIRFARICDLVGADHESERLNEELYLTRVSEYRSLLEANTPIGFDVFDAIANDPDVSKTYKGYKKFLMSERDDRTNRSRSQTERENGEIAKSMILRGKAFAETIKTKYPDSVRLSIHPSSDTNKVSITMLPQENEVVMTPWHGAVVRGADGSVSMSHAISVPAITHDIVYINGQASYFRERSDVFNWPAMDVVFEFLYPCGILIKPANPASVYPLSMVDMQKVRTLAMTCSPIVLRGFSNTKDRRTFIAKAYDLGPVLPWKSGVIQEVRNESNNDPQSNSVVSAEAMPMHYDGMFKIITVKDERTGKEKKVSDTPHFQYFVSQSAAQPGDGFTLFASSDLFARYLPQAYNIKKLEKIRWTCRSHGFFHHIMEDIPLVVRHPTRNSPCIRWHQPWPKWRTAYGYADISIDNGSQSLIPLVDSLLFDRRVCLRFSWQEGDVLVSDNFAMLHTRTSFSTYHPRELWRIHTA